MKCIYIYLKKNLIVPKAPKKGYAQNPQTQNAGRFIACYYITDIFGSRYFADFIYKLLVLIVHTFIIGIIDTKGRLIDLLIEEDYK